MATIKSEYRNGVKPMPTPSGPETVTVYTEVTLTSAQVANGNVVQFFDLPAGCVPVGYKINNDDLDTGGTAMTADFGILTTAGTAISTAAADGGDEWIDGMTTLTGAALTLHTASRAAFDVLASVQKSAVDRVVAIVFMGAPTTAAGGGIGVEFSYRAA